MTCVQVPTPTIEHVNHDSDRRHTVQIEGCLRILIADDEGATRLKLESVLTSLGHEVVVACDGNEAWASLQREDAPSLAIIDWIMPGLDGVEVCRRVRDAGRRPYVYLIMLSAKEENEDLVAGMEAGADDYLRKPFNRDELRVRVRAGERMLELHEELLAKATHDDLTGILNRGTVLELVERELALVGRKGVSAGIILADLDNFKTINDTYGHPIGDAVLREATKRLALAMPAGNAIGRYGGEEFLVLLRDCGAAFALEIAERMRASVADQPICTAAGLIPITVSLGVAVVDPESAMDLQEVIAAADEALYRAKRAGRNRVDAPALERLQVGI
jgi:two-component system cell cycle response regulator